MKKLILLLLIVTPKAFVFADTTYPLTRMFTCNTSDLRWSKHPGPVRLSLNVVETSKNNYHIELPVEGDSDLSYDATIGVVRYPPQQALILSNTIELQGDANGTLRMTGINQLLKVGSNPKVKSIDIKVRFTLFGKNPDFQRNYKGRCDVALDNQNLETTRDGATRMLQVFGQLEYSTIIDDSLISPTYEALKIYPASYSRQFGMRFQTASIAGPFIHDVRRHRYFIASKDLSEILKSKLGNTDSQLFSVSLNYGETSGELWAKCHDVKNCKIEFIPEDKTLNPEPTPEPKPKFGLHDLVIKDTTAEKYCSKASFGVCYMTFENATEYCSSQNKRLPTAREFALLATSMGAEGLRSNSGDYISGSNNGVTSDNFWYSYIGYKSPSPDDLGDNFFWSSTSYHGLTPTGRLYFSGGRGMIGLNYGSPEDYAVICINK